MRAIALLLAAVIAVPYAPSAHACGHCHGDDIASVYDGDVVAAAHKAGKCVAYMGVQGTYGKSLSERVEVTAAVAAVKGVERKSTFAAETNPAIRAIFDPKKTNAAKIAIEATKTFAKTGDLRLTVLKEECPAAK